MKDSQVQQQKFDQLMQNCANKELALKDLELQLSQESKRLAEKQETISKLNDEIRQKSAEMDENLSKLAENEDIVAKLSGEVKEKKEQLDAHQRARLSKVTKRMMNMDLTIAFTHWMVCLYVSVMI